MIHLSDSSIASKARKNAARSHVNFAYTRTGCSFRRQVCRLKVKISNDNFNQSILSRFCRWSQDGFFFIELSNVILADWTCCLSKQPVVDAFWVELVKAWQNLYGLFFHKSLDADWATCRRYRSLYWLPRWFRVAFETISRQRANSNLHLVIYLSMNCLIELWEGLIVISCEIPAISLPS